MLTEIRKTARALDHAQGVFYNQLFSIFLEGQLYISLAIHTHCLTGCHTESASLSCRLLLCHTDDTRYSCAPRQAEGAPDALIQTQSKALSASGIRLLLALVLPFLTAHLSEVRPLAGVLALIQWF